MREVAAELGTTTSNVSQSIAALSRDVGVALIEPDGRRVRLTPAGSRLATNAVAIVAAVDAARLDLDSDAEPVGTVRVAGFATAIRRSLLPAIARLADSAPQVRISILEHEPLEAFDLLAKDAIDLALVYDYNLAPAAWRDDHEASPLWSVEWGLGVRSGSAGQRFADYADQDWIVNSRHTADEVVTRTLASMAGFTPRIAHRVDSLELEDDLILSGHGVGLLPQDRPVRRGLTVLPLSDPPVALRAYAVTRMGRSRWAPLRAVLDLLPF